MAAEMAGSQVKLEDIWFSFTTHAPILRGLDLHVGAGDFVAVVGSSGCGKSTLLRLLAGLVTPTTGQVLKQGAKSTGYVFQEPHLMPWRTVFDNVALALELQGIPREQHVAPVGKALEWVGLQDCALAFPHALSGGMKMRVSLARALVHSPDLLLLDEPFAALDELTRVQLEEDLFTLWKRRRMSVVLVTHSFSEAVFLTERIYFLSKKSGKFESELKVDLGQERGAALRASPAYASKVAECRQLFEKCGGQPR